MRTAWRITFDCADPAVLAAFWCQALGYVEGTPPAGFATWTEWLAISAARRLQQGAAASEAGPGTSKPGATSGADQG